MNRIGKLCIGAVIAAVVLISDVVHAAPLQTISIEAGIRSRPALTDNLLYEGLFGTSDLFRLDFQFSSFAPTSMITGPGFSSAGYDLKRIDVTAGNGRFFSLDIGVHGLHITVDNQPGGLHFLTADVDRNAVLATTGSLFSQDDTDVRFYDFRFDFLSDALVNGGFPNTTLAALSYLNNVPTPLSQGFYIDGHTDFGPNGEFVFIDTGFDFSFENYSVISNPALIPIPAALPLFLSGLGLLGFAGWRRKRAVRC